MKETAYADRSGATRAGFRTIRSTTSCTNSKIKRVQFNNALAEALGLSIEATVAPDTPTDPRLAQFLGDPDTFRMAIPGQAFGCEGPRRRKLPSPCGTREACSCRRGRVRLDDYRGQTESERPIAAEQGRSMQRSR